MKIEIANNQNYYSINKRKIRQIIMKVLKEEKVGARHAVPLLHTSQGGGKGWLGLVSGDLSIAFVDNEKIMELNKKFLGHNEPTDVISFPLEDERQSPDTISGEIVVSAQMALETANAMHTYAERELILYVIHGLLHLVGYDDTSKKKAQEMHEREDELLTHLFERKLKSTR